MTNCVIKICNFVHYFFREGGYIDCDQFLLLLFSLLFIIFLWALGVIWETKRIGNKQAMIINESNHQTLYSEPK